MKQNWQTIRIYKRCDIKEIPDTAGCYAIYYSCTKSGKDKLCYIGSTMTLQTRLLSHLIWKNDSSRFVHHKAMSLGVNDRADHFIIKYKLSRKKGDWLMIELRLIYKLQPMCNIKRPCW